MRNNEFIVCSRASMGIYAVLKEFCIGKYVAVPWNVCPDVIFSIILANKKPYFLDYSSKLVPISKQTLNSIPTNITCLLHVHIYGSFYAITKEMKKRFPLIIDDAAQALGTTYKASKAGFNGNFGIFSFGRTKQCDLGGGGLVYSKNIKKLEKLENLIVNSKLLNNFDFDQIYNKNYDLIVSKLKLFEEYGNIDWSITNLNPAVVLKNFEGVLDKDDLVNHLKAYDPSERILTFKSFTDRLIKMNLKCAHFEVGDNPWRIVVSPKKKDFTKYIQAFKHLRSEGCNCSNWYYPSHEIFVSKIHNNHSVSLYNLCRFQFSIENISDRYKIRNEDKIIEILGLYYG